MRKFSFIVLLFCICGLLPAQSLPSLHSYTVMSIKGKPLSLSQFKGKKLMLVNTASFCGYTPQFAALQLLYQNYSQFGFEILGFPSNDFGAQDPFSDSIINIFCTSNYGVTFPMMSKVKIATGDTSKIYRWLQQANLNGKQNVSVAWNFGKFLINESGEWVKYYPSTFDPTDTAITHWIISPSSLTGVNSNKNKSNILNLSFQNPVSSDIEISLNEPVSLPVKISVYSIEGALVKQTQITLSDKESYSLKVSDLSDGVYLVNADVKDTRVTRRIIVLKD